MFSIKLLHKLIELLHLANIYIFFVFSPNFPWQILFYISEINAPLEKLWNKFSCGSMITHHFAKKHYYHSEESYQVAN